MKKYIKYVIALISLLIFCFIAINVYNGNDIIGDEIVYDFIDNYFISDKMTPYINVITWFGDVVCIIIMTIVSLVIFKDKKIRGSIIINLFFVALFNNVLKIVFMRERPNINPLAVETTYSFPSGHSMISMAFYGYLIYLVYRYIGNKKLKYLFISILSILILLVGVSRIYLGVHYTSDVIGGFCISISYLIFYIYIFERIVKEDNN